MINGMLVRFEQGLPFHAILAQEVEQGTENARCPKCKSSRWHHFTMPRFPDGGL